MRRPYLLWFAGVVIIAGSIALSIIFRQQIVTFLLGIV
jgi:hypothetical protein